MGTRERLLGSSRRGRVVAGTRLRQWLGETIGDQIQGVS